MTTTVQLIRSHIAKEHETSIDDVIEKITAAIHNIPSIQNFTVRTELEDKTAVQIIIQDSDPTSTNTDLLTTLESLPTSSSPPTLNHLTLNTTPFPPTGSLTSPIVEYVQSWFPLSETAPPATRREIEQEFEKFTEVFTRESKGDGGYEYGWIEEELQKEDVKEEGGEARGFVIARGWETMEAFKASTSTESFREAIQIVVARAAPHRMWFVERRGGK